MYKAIQSFVDLQDNNYQYNPGDTFPRTGLVVSRERLMELLTSNNRRHTPMIVLVDEPKVEPLPLTPKKEEFPMNPPEETAEDPVEKVEKKPRRGRKKKDA